MIHHLKSRCWLVEKYLIHHKWHQQWDRDTDHRREHRNDVGKHQFGLVFFYLSYQPRTANSVI